MTKLQRTLACSLAAAVLYWSNASPARAAIVIKADNTNDLNMTTSWLGGILPATLDIAQWDSTVTGANSTLLGANQSWSGIKIVNPSGAVTIGAGNTLTLGTSGIDMSAATQNLNVAAGLTLGTGNQTWNIATGSTFTATGAFTRSPGATLLIDKSTNAGTVTAAPTLTNSVLPWAIVRSSGAAANNSANGYTFATVSGGNIVAYTGATPVITSYPANNAIVNYDWSAAGTQSQIGSSRAANTIRYTGTGVTQTTNSTQTQTFNALMNAGTGTVTLGGGSTMNIQSATGELVLAAMTSGININGPIINNGVTAGAVTILGAGSNSVTLTGAGTFTGNVNVNSGTLIASRGNNNLNPTNSALGNPQVARNISVNNGGTLTFATGDTLGGANSSVVATLVINSGGTVNNVAGVFNTFGAVTLNGGTLTGSGGAASGYQMYTLRGGVTVGGDSMSTISGSGAFSGYHLAAPTSFNVNNVTAGTDLLVSGTLINRNATDGGSGALTKTGAGTMTLTGANAYTGGTTISGGTLQIGDGGTTGSLNAASAITNNAAIVYNRSDSLTAGNAMSGTGTLTKQGAGTLTLSGANTHSGATTVDAGTLGFSTTSSSIGSLAVADAAGLSVKTAAAGSTLLTTTGLTLGTSSATNLTFDFNGLNPTVAQISTGALALNGSITVGLLGTGGLNTNTYTLIDYTGALGGSFSNFANTSFTFGHSSGMLVHNVGNTSVDLDVLTDSVVWSNVLGTGAWTTAANDTGAGNWALAIAKTNANFLASDKVEFNDSFDNTNSGGGPTNLGTPQTVTIGAGDVSPATVTFNNAAVDYAIVGANGIAAGNVTKNGAGIVTLSTPNTYAGGTTLNAGTLSLNNATAIGTGALAITGGVLDAASATTLTTNNAVNVSGDFAFAGTANLSLGNGNVTLSGGDRTVTVSAGALTMGKVTNAGGGLIKNGAGTLQLNPTGISSVTGALTVSAGTLGIGSEDLTATGLAGSGTIQNGSATTRWLFITNAADNTFAGTLVDGGVGRLGFRKAGAGKMTLTGTNSYTDPTTIDAGTVEIQGANTGVGTNVTLGANAGLVIGNTSALGGASVITLASNTTGTVTFKTDGSITPYDITFGSGTTNFNIVLDSAGATSVTHGLSTQATGGVGRGNVNIALGGPVTSGTLQFDNFSMGAGSTGSNTVVNPGAGVTVLIGTAAKGLNNVSATLELSGVGTGHEVTGAISNGAPLTGGNAISVVKSGASTWTLSGGNTYTGVTNVNGGTLLVNGSLAAGSAVTVGIGATLGGTGTIAGAITVNGGTLSPGASVESLDTGALTLNNNSIFVYEIDSSAPLASGADRQNVTGNITLAGTVTLTANDIAMTPTMLAPGTKFTMFGYTGAFAGAFDGYADGSTVNIGSNLFTIDYDDMLPGDNFVGGSYANYVTLTIAAVPEASACIMIGLVAAATASGAALRRRRGAKNNGAEG